MAVSDYNITEETIQQVGLKLTDNTINAQIAPEARVFKYPNLDQVFIMESDLYGNPMPKDSCFLVFEGNHGLIGKHLKVETLRNSSVEEIRVLAEKNSNG